MRRRDYDATLIDGDTEIQGTLTARVSIVRKGRKRKGVFGGEPGRTEPSQVGRLSIEDGVFKVDAAEIKEALNRDSEEWIIKFQYDGQEAHPSVSITKGDSDTECFIYLVHP